MKLAVFGGSFDPVHVGHVEMVRYLLARDICDSMVLVPAHRSPFKAGHSASAEQRLAMLRLVFAGWAEVMIHTCELDRSGLSYTFETLRTLSAEYPDRELQLVVGQDNLANFGVWKNSADILSMAELVVFSRTTGSASPLSGDEAMAVLNDQGLIVESLMVCSDFHTPVSSREVRANLKAGGSVEGLVPPVAVEYIKENHIYSS